MCNEGEKEGSGQWGVSTITRQNRWNQVEVSRSVEELDICVFAFEPWGVQESLWKGQGYI